MVLGELILGGLARREEELLRRLPRAVTLADDEVLAFVRRRQLARRAIGWVDAHLLASALVEGALLWSQDRDLAKAATALACGFEPRG
jgi:predicted nucleic acid-binding protein